MSLCVKSFPPTRGDTAVSYDFLVYLVELVNDQILKCSHYARAPASWLAAPPRHMVNEACVCVCLSVCVCVCVCACSVLLKTNVHLKSEKKSSFR